MFQRLARNVLKPQPASTLARPVASALIEAQAPFSGNTQASSAKKLSLYAGGSLLAGVTFFKNELDQGFGSTVSVKIKAEQLENLKQITPPFSEEQIIPLINAMGYQIDRINSVKVTKDEIIIALNGNHTSSGGYSGDKLGLKDVSYKKPFDSDNDTRTSHGNPLIIIPLTPENRNILAAIESNQFTRRSFR